MDTNIRPVTIAELADAAAKRSAETGVIEPNPFLLGEDDWKQWKAAFERNLLKYTAPDAEGGC